MNIFRVQTGLKITIGIGLGVIAIGFISLLTSQAAGPIEEKVILSIFLISFFTILLSYAVPTVTIDENSLIIRTLWKRKKVLFQNITSCKAEITIFYIGRFEKFKYQLTLNTATGKERILRVAFYKDFKLMLALIEKKTKKTIENKEKIYR